MLIATHPHSCQHCITALGLSVTARLAAVPAPGLAGLSGIGCSPHSQQLSAVEQNTTPMLNVQKPHLGTARLVPADIHETGKEG